MTLPKDILSLVARCSDCKYMKIEENYRGEKDSKLYYCEKGLPIGIYNQKCMEFELKDSEL